MWGVQCFFAQSCERSCSPLADLSSHSRHLSLGNPFGCVRAGGIDAGHSVRELLGRRHLCGRVAVAGLSPHLRFSSSEPTGGMLTHSRIRLWTLPWTTADVLVVRLDTLTAGFATAGSSKLAFLPGSDLLRISSSMCSPKLESIFPSSCSTTS